MHVSRSPPNRSYYDLVHRVSEEKEKFLLVGFEEFGE